MVPSSIQEKESLFTELNPFFQGIYERGRKMGEATVGLERFFHVDDVDAGQERACGSLR
jgi:hypothetical protein